MSDSPLDPLVDALTRLKDNTHWRYYVDTLGEKRNGAIRALLYGKETDLQTLRGEARAYDQMVENLKRNGVKT